MILDVDAATATTKQPSVQFRRTLVLRLAAGLVVGIVLVLVFLQFIDFRAVATRLEHLNVAIALLCGAVFLSAYAVRALRWRWFLLPDKVTRTRVIGIYYVATFLNWALPVQGGELAKSLILRRSDNIPVSRSLATVAMDKAMDLLPAVVIVMVVPFTTMQLSATLWWLLVLASAAFIAGMVVLLLASWQRDRTLAAVARVFESILPQRVGLRVAPFVADFVDTLLSLARRRRVLLIASVYTAVAATLDALFCYLAFLAVGVTVSWTTALVGYTLYNLVYILPTPPAHLGSNELVGLLVFSGMFGVSRTGVGAMFLFSHPWTGLLMTSAALCSLRVIGLDFRTVLGLRANAERMAEK
jgi:uncharacterized protein (TIRG00374 family)